MRIARGIGVAIAALVLSSVLAVLAPGGGASTHTVAIEDDTGDATVCVTGQDASCAVSPDPEAPRHVDLTRVAFGKETGKNFTIEFTVASMATDPPTLATTMKTTRYLACFTYASVPFGVTALLVHNGPTAADKAPQPGQLFVPEQGCNFATLDTRVAEVGLNYPEDVGIDFEKGLLWLRVQRKDLADLHGLAGQDVRAPQPGDTLDDLSAATFAFYQVAGNTVTRAQDSAGPGGPFPFTVATANELLEIRVKTNTVDRGTRVPEYSVDAGGFQAIPVEVVNRANEEKNVNLTVALTDGDAAKWKFSLVPFVRVPGIDDDGNEGLRIVTLVVEPQKGIEHLEPAKVEITASFVDQPEMRGSIEVAVKAIFPPSVESPKLWLHFGPDRFGNDHVWMNTLKDDPLARDGEEGVYTPNPDGGTFTIWADPDVQPSKDLILDAQREMVLNLNVTSSTEADVEYLAFMTNGDDRVVAKGDGRVTAPSGKSALTILMPVVPLSRDDVELRVESGAGKGIRLWLRMEPSGSGGVDSPVGAVGRAQPVLDLHIPGSSLGMPIVRTEAPGLTNISQKGARISLNLVQEKDLHVNPGKTRALNFTVLNEGVYDDTIQLRLAFNQSSGWRIALLPTATFKLPPGEGDDFAIFVTPPLRAEEESKLLLEVLAASKLDPTVVSKLRYEFIVTKGVQLDDDGGLAAGLKPKASKKQGGLPGFEALAAFAALGAAVAVARRRRD